MVVKVCDAVSSSQFSDEFVRHVCKQSSLVASWELNCVHNSSLSSDCGKWTYVVVCEETQKLMTQASSPNWENVTVVILLDCILQNVVGV